jgi:ABC-2 type transport system permease protein
VNDIAVIFQTEFLRRLRSRPYILGTLFGALGLLLVVVLPSVIDNAFGAAGKRIVLAGPPALVAQAKPFLAKDYDVVDVEEAVAQPSIDFLDAHGNAAALVVLRGGSDGLHVTVYARDAGAVRSAVGDDLVPLNVALATHVPQAQIDRLLVVPVETKSFDANFASRASAESAKGIALALLTILYLAIILNAQNILASVAEEKTSRIAELLVATVAPSKLLTGKILATGATGVLQIAVWCAVAYAAGPFIAAQFGDPNAGASAGGLFSIASLIRPGVLAAFVVFFIIGFVQYALLYAAAASLISRTEDIGSVVAPLVIPVVAGFLLAQVAVVAPNSGNVVALSLIPLVSPFVMFTRVAVATIPAWQIALALAINLGVIWLTALGAGKIYRVGLLTYGRPPKLGQVWAVIRS